MALLMTTQAPVEMQVALIVFAAVGLALAAHEDGWLAYLRDRRVIAGLAAVLLALVLTQTIHAATIYDLRIYCDWAWWDVFLC